SRTLPVALAGTFDAAVACAARFARRWAGRARHRRRKIETPVHRGKLHVPLDILVACECAGDRRRRLPAYLLQALIGHVCAGAAAGCDADPTATAAARAWPRTSAGSAAAGRGAARRQRGTG